MTLGGGTARARAMGGVVGFVAGLLLLVLGFIFVTAIDKQTAEWVYVEWALLAIGSVLTALAVHELVD